MSGAVDLYLQLAKLFVGVTKLCWWWQRTCTDLLWEHLQVKEFSDLFEVRRIVRMQREEQGYCLSWLVCRRNQEKEDPMLLPNLNSVVPFCFEAQNEFFFCRGCWEDLLDWNKKMCLSISKSCDARRFLSASLCLREEINFIWTRQLKKHQLQVQFYEKRKTT